MFEPGFLGKFVPEIDTANDNKEVLGYTATETRVYTTNMFCGDTQVQSLPCIHRRELPFPIQTSPDS